MNGTIATKIAIFFMALFISLPLLPTTGHAATGTKQTIYDFAKLLDPQEISELEALANEYGSMRETAFVIITTNDTNGRDVVEFTQDFYYENELGYDKKHGNTAILTIDMQHHREIYLAGFYKAKEYLDDHRLDLIREKITPDLTAQNYYDAFRTYIETSYEYMGIRPGVNPNNILYKTWFQLVVSIGLAGIVVGSMAYNSGGKVTVSGATYQDNQASAIKDRKDQFIRKTVTKVKKPSNDNKGGGGGGITRGSHSHSGSRGSF